MRAIVIREFGGPEALRFTDVEIPAPGPNEIRVRVAAAGVNFLDLATSRNANLGHFGNVPLTPGVEGAGYVVQIGSGVTDFEIGDRVAWFFVIGSYAEELVASADSFVPVPDTVSDIVAAGTLMQALTAHHLAYKVRYIRDGDFALIHSVAGGVGLLLTQMIKRQGGVVIGTVSSEEKIGVAEEMGADHVIVCTGNEFVEGTGRLTNGRGVSVAYDGRGAASYRGSLDVLERHGTLAYFGPNLSHAEPIDLLTLQRSVFVCYPVVHDHVPTTHDLRARSAEIFEMVSRGHLVVNIGREYTLEDAARAHADLISRRTVGKLVLTN